MSKAHPRFFHAHISGHWKATVAQFIAMLDYLVDHEGRNLLTGTEVSPDKFRAPLIAWAKRRGWDIQHPDGKGKNECFILSEHPIAKRKAWRLTPLRLPFGRTAPIYLIAARLRNGPWVAVWHSPAHNDGLSKRGKAAPWTRVYVSALTGLHVARMRMRKGHVLLAGDWNWSLARKIARQTLGADFPKMRWGWHKGQKPTEGGRVIDGVLTNLVIVKRSWTLAKRFAGLDHRAVLTNLG